LPEVLQYPLNREASFAVLLFWRQLQSCQAADEKTDALKGVCDHELLRLLLATFFSVPRFSHGDINRFPHRDSYDFKALVRRPVTQQTARATRRVPSTPGRTMLNDEVQPCTVKP